MKFTVIAAVFLMLASCTSTPKKETPLSNNPFPESSANIPAALPESDGQNIDYVGLQRSLSLDRSFDELGYDEKEFNTCEVGYGYSSSHHCQRQFFVVIHFRLLCRDTDGTISTILMDDELTPIAQKSLKWNLKGFKGVLQTDDRGYGQIRTISSISQKRERLKLLMGNEFLYVRANEITKITTPKPWCDQVPH